MYTLGFDDNYVIITINKEIPVVKTALILVLQIRHKRKMNYNQPKLSILKCGSKNVYKKLKFFIYLRYQKNIQ